YGRPRYAIHSAPRALLLLCLRRSARQAAVGMARGWASRGTAFHGRGWGPDCVGAAVLWRESGAGAARAVVWPADAARRGGSPAGPGSRAAHAPAIRGHRE